MAEKTKFSLFKKEKKELTQKQQKIKTIMGWVSSIICIVVIVFALVVAIFTIAGATNDRHLMQFGDKIYMNVASDSMSPTFDKSDMIITKSFDPDTQGQDLKVGQVITFTANIGGYQGFNTHRIIHLNRNKETGQIMSVRTRGDKRGADWKASLCPEGEEPSTLGPDGTWDSTTVNIKDIVATWGEVDEEGNFTEGSMLKGVGAFSNWIQDVDNPGEDSQARLRFFCIIVLPLILLFVIYAFILIRTLIIAKLENSKPVEAEQVVTIDSLSDEEKRRLAEEYILALQKSANGAQDNAPQADAPQEEPAPQVDGAEPSATDDVDVADGNVDAENAEVLQNADDSQPTDGDVAE